MTNENLLLRWRAVRSVSGGRLKQAWLGTADAPDHLSAATEVLGRVEPRGGLVFASAHTRGASKEFASLAEARQWVETVVHLMGYTVSPTTIAELQDPKKGGSPKSPWD